MLYTYFFLIFGVFIFGFDPTVEYDLQKNLVQMIR